VALETTVFSFKISVPFEQWAEVYDSEENKQLMKEEKIVCLYRGINKEDPSSAIVIEQAEEGKSIAMFSNPEVRPLIVRKLDKFMIQPSSLVTYKVN